KTEMERQKTQVGPDEAEVEENIDVQTGKREVLEEEVYENDDSNPTPSSSPNRMESKNAGVWTVSSGANRDSRNVQDSAPIPPVAPTIALHAKTDTYSKKLKSSINEYLESNKTYEKAVADYRNKGKGTRQNLWNMYNEAMEKYVAYHLLAKEEGNFVRPLAANKTRTNTMSDTAPEPPQPSKPKAPAPLELLKELKTENAKIILNGKEITYEKAEEMLEGDNSINVKVNRENGKRPVMELSTE
ncbi:MAG TPA: hypothetical protein VFM69_13220, partial [Pricia sp.]|nr:hypothetical protein [Pricia sp.]